MMSRYRYTGLQYIPEIKICLSNLGAYTRGRSIYEEISLPVDPEEIEKAIHKVLTFDRDCKVNGDEEVFISSWETELDYTVREHTNVFELNDLLNNLQDALISRTYMDVEEINAVIRACDNDLEEAIERIDSQDYEYISGIDSLEKLGIEIVNTDSRFKDLSEDVKMYLDYEAIGQDTDINANGGFYSDLKAFINLY